MFRYFSTQRPVSPGRFPEKPGCVVSNYPERFYVNSAGTFAWGHIDYTEPLTDDEIGFYELSPERYEYSVKFILNSEQIRRLYNLLILWQNYIDEDGCYPFKDYTIKDMFETVMTIGSFYIINEQIEAEERRRGMNNCE